MVNLEKVAVFHVFEFRLSFLLVVFDSLKHLVLKFLMRVRTDAILFLNHINEEVIAVVFMYLMPQFLGGGLYHCQSFD